MRSSRPVHRLVVPVLTSLLILALAVTTRSLAAPKAPKPPAKAATEAAPDSAPPRLSRDVVPTSEAIDLVLDPEQEDYSGRVRIALQVKERTTSLRFHARALTIEKAWVHGAAGDVPAKTVERLVPDQARIVLSTPLDPGDYTLEIQFHNAYNTRAVALYRVVTGGHSYLFTQFEDTEAREAFPCWDEPEFKIPWTLSLTVPSGDLAVSNSPIAKQNKVGELKRVEFRTTKPLPSYLVAIAVGPFETVAIDGLKVPGRVITVKGAAAMATEAAKATGPIVRSLERYFGRPYPYEKLDLIAAPEFLYGAMENAGAIVFADRRLLIDPRSKSPEQRRQLTGVIAHEVAHMWFGDLVTMKWWDDLWLNESFASWMTIKVLDDVFPEQKAGTTALYSVQRAMSIDSRLSTRAMREKVVGSTSLGQTANELTYDKGKAVLSMFEGWIGVEPFRAGVLQYLKAHEWGNAEAKDLWDALGSASGENIDAAMATFLDQPGVPIVSVEPLPGGRVRLSQRRFLTRVDAPRNPGTWRVPVTLRYPTRQGLGTRRVLLTTPETVEDLGLGRAPAWIEPNAGANGYYRWNLPGDMLDSLVAARSRLDPRERIDLIANLTAQLRGGLLHGDRYLALLAPMAQDPSPEVVNAVLGALNDTRTALLTPRSESAYSAFLRETLSPAVERFGMSPRASEPVGVSLMRPTLLYLLARSGHDSRAVAYAESLGRAYRRDPASIPASLSDFGIEVGATRGDRAQFDDYRKRFEATNVPIERSLYLSGLGHFEDPALRKAALDYALTGPLRPQETLMIPNAMAVNGLGGDGGRGSGLAYPDDVTHWMFDHFADLRAKMPPNFSSRIMGLGGGCSSDRITALKAYFREPAHKVMGGDNTLRRLGDAIEECASLHDRESSRVERWMMLRSGQP
jgi:alanyl aminopeptidase